MDKVLGIWERKVRKVGHAHYIAIPPELLKASGVKTGDKLTLQLISNGNIVILNDSKKLEVDAKNGNL